MRGWRLSVRRSKGFLLTSSFSGKPEEGAGASAPATGQFLAVEVVIGLGVIVPCSFAALALADTNHRHTLLMMTMRQATPPPVLAQVVIVPQFVASAHREANLLPEVVVRVNG